MPEPFKISSRSLVSDFLALSPLVAHLFVALRVDCGGCSMNKFCTLEEMCRQYDLDLEQVGASLQRINSEWLRAD